MNISEILWKWSNDHTCVSFKAVLEFSRSLCRVSRTASTIEDRKCGRWFCEPAASNWVQGSSRVTSPQAVAFFQSLPLSSPRNQLGSVDLSLIGVFWLATLSPVLSYVIVGLRELGSSQAFPGCARHMDCL